MFFSLKNKIAFITGGCSGIGLAIAKRYTEAGAKVIIADRQEGKAIGEEIGAIYYKMDVTNEQQVLEVMERVDKEVGKLDILVNNAGIGDLPGPIVDAATKNWRRIFEVNVFGVLYGIKYGAPIINKGGVIINTASQAAFTKIGGMEPYSASKAAVVSITQTAALELAERQIRVNAVCPSNTKTPMMKASEDAAISEKLSQVFSPSGKAAEVSDIMGLYHFLASDASQYINGQSIIADGGWTAGVSNTALGAALSDL